MKLFASIVIAVVLLTGCSYKNNNIVLNTYETNYSSDIVKDKKIYLSSIKDMRVDKSSIGYVEENGQKAVILHSDTDFVKEYEKAFFNAARIAGFEKVLDAQSADYTLDIYIKNITLVYEDKTFGENLKGSIEIQSVIKIGQKTITQTFKEQGGKWIAPSHDSKDLEPFLQQLFNQSVNDAVSRLAKLQ